MTIQYSVAVRNAQLATINDTALAGAAGFCGIQTGSPPANVAAAATGTLLAAINLPDPALTPPADFFNAPSGGSMTKSGTWTDTSADATGTAGWFWLSQGGVSSRCLQGTVGISGSGADMIVDSVNFTAGQTFTVLTFTLTAGNA